MMLPNPDEIIRPIPTNKARKRIIIYATVFGVLLVVIIALSVVIKRTNERNVVYSTASDDNLDEDDDAFWCGEACLGGPDYDQFVKFIEEALLVKGVASQLENEDSHQWLAFDWIWRTLKFAKSSHVIQRFALACLHFALKENPSKYWPEPDEWDDSTGWMRPSDECTWYGIQCRGDGEWVTGINLNDNSLAGFLPPETALLSDNLRSIDMGANYIYMTQDMFGFVSQLTNLDTLLIDDNFIETTDGIPLEFKHLTKLDRLRLSNNRIRGPLKGRVVMGWKQITLIEIEDNQMTGSLPTQLGSLPKLEYLYLRKNKFSSNLDFIKQNPSNFPLTELWLDSNDIGGSIPTEIGLLTSLDSLSLANCSLTGTIPSEMGNIPELSKAWLLRNNLKGQIPSQIGSIDTLEVFEVKRNILTGTMPNEICQAVENSGSVRISITADCDELTCTCCTNCEHSLQPPGNGD